MNPLEPVTESTDVHVVSLTDRRKIQALERQVENLTNELSAALGRARPALERAHGKCYHSAAFEVCENTPEVRCKACGDVVDPYDVLRRIAMREVNFCYTLNGLRDETKRLTKEVEQLKGKRARQRAAVSRATPDVPWTDVAAAMKLAGADSVLVRDIGSHYGAWFYMHKGIVATAGPCRTAREAIHELVTRATAPKEGTPIR